MSNESSSEIVEDFFGGAFGSSVRVAVICITNTWVKGVWLNCFTRTTVGVCLFVS